MAPVVARLHTESEPYLVPGKILVQELWFEVPLDHSKPSGRMIKLFARSAVRYERPIVEPKEPEELPYLLFLQGGPGGGCPAPQDSTLSTHMLPRGYKLLFLDQRGTGLSCTVSADILRQHVGGPQEQADYLKLFRADTLVKDSEAVRRCLTKDYPPEKQKWSTFGQSFGGMMTLTYLSFAPEGLRECFITGGLAALDKGPDEIYQTTFQRVVERNRAYYNKFPDDVVSVRLITETIRKEGGERGIPLPTGGFLTAQRFLTIGVDLGMDGGLDRIHNLVVRMMGDLNQFAMFSYATLSIISHDKGWDDAPIYSVLHEPAWCYAPGIASKWSAHRVGSTLPEFQWLRNDWDGPPSSSSEAPSPSSEQPEPEQPLSPPREMILGNDWTGLLPSPSKPSYPPSTQYKPQPPLFFSGEMIFPFLFDTCAELMKFKETAQILADYDEWSPLYDIEQLGKNEVPVYAATYNDMYVDAGMARVTASKVKGIKVFETNVLYHSALRTKPNDVFRELLALRDDTID
ncbi:alpha/beta-hydrolase [Poronia punctata]|nr:alpha/beta-hydrolase [Poronia punctata]